MKLIIGLGNPGKKYNFSWHNLGFQTIEELREILALPAFKKSDKFKADMTSGVYGQEKLILAKPLTYMNNSGDSVLAIAGFYKIKPAEIIVIHDDLDLPLGRIRLAQNSSAGGHNGLKSIIEKLGTKNFNRIKIGIRTAELEKFETADYVLMNPKRGDQSVAKEQIKKAAEAAKDILETGLAKAMNKWN